MFEQTAASGFHDERALSDEDASTFDVIVLGAGISGLVSASVLARQGQRRLLIVDEYAHVGGNHIDCSVGDYTFDVGSFIFQDDSPLLDHFPELLAEYVPIKPSFARLNPQGIVTRYPFSVRDDLLAAGPVEIARILLSVAYARVFQADLTDARSFARYWIGERLLKRAGLENYMRRFYGVAPDKIDLQFAHKRMLWIKERAQLRTHLRALWKEHSPKANTQLARPRSGFAQLYRPARELLERAGVSFMLGTKLERLSRASGRFQLFAGGARIASARRVVSTIPIPRAQALCGLAPERLETVALISLFYSFAGDRRFSQPVLFNFSHRGAWKRLTMHSDFYGRVHGREYFGVEVNADHVAGSVEHAHEDFRRHTRDNRLFLGDLKLEGSHLLPSAYPIYVEGAAQRAAVAITSLQEFGVESFGRQGGFDYQPTARVSTRQAEASLATR